MNNDLHAESKGYEIDLPDLIARIFRKWAIVLICIIIGAVLGSGICLLKNRNAVAHVITQKDVDIYRTGLSEEQAERVEYLYMQNQSYEAYRKSLQDYLQDSFYSSSEFKDSTFLTAIYYIESDINHVNQVFRLLSLDQEDYESIAKILGKDQSVLDDVYRRVIISDIWTGSMQENNAKDNKVEDNSLLRVSIIADNREQIEGILEIIDISLNESLSKLKTVDDEITITLIGEKYTDNASDFIKEWQQEAIDEVNDANFQIYQLKSEYVDQLASSEKGYYNLLTARDDHSIIAADRNSLKRFFLIGAVIGVIIGCVIVILQYLLDGKIKTRKEVSERFHVVIPYVIYRKHSGFQLFRKVIRRLRGADFSDEEIRQSLVVSDISIQLEKNACKSAYIICENITDTEGIIADEIKKSLISRNPQTSFYIGNPASGVEELETVSDVESVLIIAQLQVTRYHTMEKWTQLCIRYKLPIISVILIEEC